MKTHHDNGDLWEGSVLTIKQGAAHVEAGAYEGRHDIAEVNFPGTITRIGVGAFSGCPNIVAQLHLGDNVREIGDRAFEGCTGITMLYLPTGLTTIGSDAFAGCSGITMLHLPTGLTTIGSNAFAGCTGLTSLHLPDGLIHIGSEAFAQCWGITTTRLPGNVVVIDEDAFDGCTRLGANTNEQMSDLGMCVRCRNGDTLKNGVLTIKEGAVRIEAGAYAGRQGIVEVLLPNTVTEIGGAVTKPDEHTLTWFDECGGGDYGHDCGHGWCSSCQRSWGDTVLCRHLVDEREKRWLLRARQRRLRLLRARQRRLWSTNNHLRHRAHEEAYDDHMFCDDWFDEHAQWLSDTIECLQCSDRCCHRHCDRDDGAFLGCTGITTLHLAEGLVAIGSYAFMECENITVLHLPTGLTTIGVAAFACCTGITVLHLPDSLTAIGDRAFAECKRITTLHLPKGLKTIGKKAFVDCSSIAVLHLPDDLTVIGHGAFDGCVGLSEDMHTRIEGLGVMYSNGDTLEGGVLTIKEGTVRVEAGAYKDREDIVEVRFPDTVVEIRWETDWRVGGAFEGCSGITTLNLPDNLAHFHRSVFSGCTGLDADSLLRIKLFTHTYDNGDTFEDGVLTVKEGAVRVEAGAYKDREDIVEVRFPGTVVEIGGGWWNGAFQGCLGITTLHLPDTLAKISGHAFRGCSGITTLHLPDTLAEIGEWAFHGCSGITTLHLPDTLTKIGGYAFRGCSGITTLHLPDKLASIGKRAFHNCAGITSVCLPAQLAKVWGDKEADDYFSVGSFEGCTSLARVLAPDALVGNDMANAAMAFLNCPVLKANGGPGLTRLSSIKPIRLHYWHEAMHRWCPNQAAKDCVLATLICERRVDAQAEQRETDLPSLDHELWLLILTFIRRDQLGAYPTRWRCATL